LGLESKIQPTKIGREYVGEFEGYC
jgi:hypothetical protein